jgi:CBS domain-containing protein
VCPIQRKQIEAGGEELLVCSEPHCVLADWQIVEVEKLPNEQVRYFMTADPVVIKPEVSVRALARMMIDAHIHRVIVVDDENKPIGVVSSTDVLAAIAYAE